MLSLIICTSLIQAVNDERAFQEMLDVMPSDLRADTIRRRTEARLEKQRQKEHADLVYALKPHTLWSFLGLTSK